MQESILIVEDDASVAEALNEILTGEHYFVSIAQNAQQTLSLLKKETIDLLILDVNLDSENGYDLCRKIRGFSDVPVIFLTARIGENDLIQGFQSGGDDYLTKPFRLQELLVRIQALLKRAARQNSMVYKSGNLTFNLTSQQVFLGDVTLDLTATERQLLLLFLKNYPRTLSREELLYQIWDKDSLFVQENTLSVNISRLRDKLGNYENQNYITTLRGIGYQWSVPVKR